LLLKNLLLNQIIVFLIVPFSTFVSNDSDIDIQKILPAELHPFKDIFFNVLQKKKKKTSSSLPL